MVDEAITIFNSSRVKKLIKQPEAKPHVICLSSKKKNGSRFWAPAALGFLIVAGLILSIKIFLGNSLFNQQKSHFLFSTDVSLVQALIQLNNALQTPTEAQFVSDDELKVADTEESELNRRTPTGSTHANLINTSRFVVVARGDSLYDIILREYGEYDETKLKVVLRENLDVTNPDLIIEGEVIMLPSPSD
jgi:hypothetical protein